MSIDIDPLEDGRGVRVRDTAEGEQFSLRTDAAVDPTPAPTDGFTMPVDTAAAVEASELHVPGFSPVILWADGEVVHRAASADEAERLGPGTYEVDFSPPAAQLYVRVEDAVVTPGFAGDHTYLETETPTRLVLGLRSHHERPAGVVTVTDDPRDVMAGVSALGSALKTHSPDRSWPTLRGHPPAIERGDELDVPEEVGPPDTGVTLEVPPSYGAIFAVAPLAYYLGATVEAGPRPRLLAAGGEYRFDAGDLAADVRDVLEHVFTLDCVVRSVGVYPFRTPAADELDERVDLDYEALFGVSLAERTAAYLDVPRSATADLLAWHYTADVAPDPKYAPALPHLVDELAAIRSPPVQSATLDLTPTPNALDSADGALARSAADSDGGSCPVVVPADADTPGQSWVGEGFAAHAANPTVGSFRRAFEWPAGEGSLDVHVVYNDARLDAGDDTAYDAHPYQETDVATSHDLSTNELRDVLSEEVDFLHFVGHVTEAGMVCRDGVLDVRTLARTGVRAFFLNGCRSYEQGRALLTAGSVGGIVTVDDVADATAGRVGRTVALLLDAGYSLYAILAVLDLAGLPADRYTILGDGTLAVRRPPSSGPVLPEFDTSTFGPETDPLPLCVHHFPYGENGMGALLSQSYTDTESYLQTGSVRELTMPRAELPAFLADDGIPTLLDGDVHLTDDLSAADFA